MYSLEHTGVKRRSGRYPYGSGDRPFQGESSSRRKELKAERKAQKAAKREEKRIRKASAKAPYNRKTIKSLSDAEINKRIERLQLEKRLKDLSRGEVSRGRKAIEDILEYAATETGKTVAKNAGIYLSKKLIAQTFGDEVAKEMFGGQQQKKKKKDDD